MRPTIRKLPSHVCILCIQCTHTVIKHLLPVRNTAGFPGRDFLPVPVANLKQPYHAGTALGQWLYSHEVPNTVFIWVSWGKKGRCILRGEGGVCAGIL